MSANLKSTPDLRMIPLGLFSIGVGLFLAGGQLYGATDPGPFIAFGLLAAGLGTLITGFWAFRADNIFGGVAQSAIGTLFASFALYSWFFSAGAKNSDADIAWTAFAAAVVLGMIAIASFKANIPRPASVTLLLFFLFLALLWAGSAFHAPMVLKISGVIAILTAIMAWVGAYMRLVMSL